MPSGNIEDVPVTKSKWETIFEAIPPGKYRSFEDDEEGRAAYAALRSFQTRYSKKRFLDYGSKRVKGVTFILHNRPEGAQQ